MGRRMDHGCTFGLMSRRVGIRGTFGTQKGPIGLHVPKKPPVAIKGTPKIITKHDKLKINFKTQTGSIKGPPYILAKSNSLNRLIKGFVSVAKKTFSSKHDILFALIDVANQELKKLNIPLPTTPREIPKGAATGGGFSRGNDQPGYPNGLWEIKFMPKAMDLTPIKKPKEFAEQCGTVAHEYEHLVDTYMAVRFAIASGDSEKYISTKMLIPSIVIKHAKSNQLKVNSEESLLAEQFYWFEFFNRLDTKIHQPAKKLENLEAISASLYLTIEALKRYNDSDAEVLEFEYGKNISRVRRNALIQELKRKQQNMEQRLVEARKKYEALPMETVAHIAEKIFIDGMSKALSAVPR